MKIGNGTKLWKPELSNIGECIIGDNCKIHSHVWIADRVTIGNNCKVQAFAFIPEGVHIGNNVFIGPRVTFTNDKNPPSGEWSTTIVEDFVSIGAGAIILPGITLGTGCRIGAGAVVTKSIPPNVVVCGVPAREHLTQNQGDI